MKKLIGMVLLSLALVFAPLGGEAATASARENADGYFGFGPGGGAGWVSQNPYPFFSLMLKFGAVINPHLLAGMELTHFGILILGFYHIDGMCTWFLDSDLGLFVKGGAGFGMYSHLSEDWQREEEFGLDLRAGVGYELQLGEQFHLGVEVVYGAMLLGSGMTNDIVGLLVLTWYSSPSPSDSEP